MSGVTIWFGLATEGPPADLPASTRSGLMSTCNECSDIGNEQRTEQDGGDING